MKFCISHIVYTACVLSVSILGAACSDDDEKTATVTTLAGTGTKGYADGAGSTAKFSTPSGVTADASGNIYVTDFENFIVRKVTASGEVSSVAGQTSAGYLNGVGDLAKFYGPNGVAADANGNLFVCDEGNHCIRMITPEGKVTTYVGGGIPGMVDGETMQARFNSPSGIAIDKGGNLYVADQGNNSIRKITPQRLVITIAGNGEASYADGTGSAARFYRPTGVATDANGNIYVADLFNHRIRKITETGVVTTVAGTGAMGFANGAGNAAKFRYPAGLALDAKGNIYVADSENHCIRKIDTNQQVTTLTGSSEGFADGALSNALFSFPREIEIDASGNMYVADAGNNRIRKISGL